MYSKNVQGLGLRFHEPNVAFVIEPAGSLLDYLVPGFCLASYLGAMKSHPQALYIFANMVRFSC
jgi:hypothetical protein